MDRALIQKIRLLAVRVGSGSIAISTKVTYAVDSDPGQTADICSGESEWPEGRTSLVRKREIC